MDLRISLYTLPFYTSPSDNDLSKRPPSPQYTLCWPCAWPCCTAVSTPPMVPLVVDPGCKGTMALSACWLGFAFRGPMLVSIPHAHTCDGNQEVVVLVSKLRACIDRACVNKCVCPKTPKPRFLKILFELIFTFNTKFVTGQF